MSECVILEEKSRLARFIPNPTWHVTVLNAKCFWLIDTDGYKWLKVNKKDQ